MEKTKVLIVDDHPMVRERLAEVINEQRDLMVCGATEDARQAMATIDESEPGIVLLDLSLKGTFSFELLKDIKARHPRLPVLVVSMHDESLFAERVLRAGARGYINKEEPTAKVMMAIRRVLGGDIYLSERMATRLVQKHVVNGASRTVSAIDRLSNRELEIFELIGHGRGTAQIAETLHIDPRTVETYRARIKEKLNLQNSIELLQHAIQWVQSGASSQQP